jgi:hypothetical protein
MAEMPAWRAKHECVQCGKGYGECIQGWTGSLMCCNGCEHPSRWATNPYTAEELAEMREGR